MSDATIRVLLDQNVPREVGAWLRQQRPLWEIRHASEVGLEGKPDDEVFEWAQRRSAIVITFDEDFADRRMFSSGTHHGVIRLRVWPTTVEETESGLARLLDSVEDSELRNALIIVNNNRIRIRRSSS